MNTAPAKLPALRGLRWFVEAWRAALQKPLLWLPAALLLAAAQMAVIAAWLEALASIRAAAHSDFIERWGSVLSTALLAETVGVPLLGALPLFAALFFGAACRQFLPACQGARPLQRMWHALAFSAVLTILPQSVLLNTYVLVIGAAFVGQDIITGIVFAFHLILLALSPLLALWLAFWALLAQALATCGVPFSRAISNAVRAALRPAYLVHTVALAAITTAAIAALGIMPHMLPLTLLATAAIYAFALDALITPWLMARDMFRAAEQ